MRQILRTLGRALREWRIVPVAALLLGLPLVGVVIMGYPLSRFTEFPPTTRYVPTAPFSLPIFILMAMGVVVVIATLFLWPLAHWRKKGHPEGNQSGALPPAAGRRARLLVVAGIFVAGSFWAVSWLDIAVLRRIQLYSFTPLWLGYILFINGLTLRRTGRCRLLNQPARLFCLFLVSAAFWWFFEYLNRFVQNWHYSRGSEMNGLEYFLSATPPFATVLPAVLCTHDYLAGFPWLERTYRDLPPLPVPRPRLLAWVALLISCGALTMIGVWPHLLYPMLWVAPLLIIVSINVLSGRNHVFCGLRNGDWRRIVSLALAALICGFLWEMWNYCSYAKWQYTIPYVQVLHIFEMPLLGYAGYLPFGLECYTIAKLFKLA